MIGQSHRHRGGLLERRMVPAEIVTRISQMSPAGLACDLRHNPEKQGYFANSCHADRKTRWVTAKTGSCGSISMAV